MLERISLIPFVASSTCNPAFILSESITSQESYVVAGAVQANCVERKAQLDTSDVEGFGMKNNLCNSAR